MAGYQKGKLPIEAGRSKHWGIKNVTVNVCQ